MSKTLKITGKTFEHRETLKRYGAKFDGITKSWTLSDTGENREIVAKMTGVTIAEATEEYKPATTPNQSRFSRSFGAPAPSAESVMYDQKIMGDSDEHIRTFGECTNFAGFSSLNAFVEFVNEIPLSVRQDTNRNNGWLVEVERDVFTRTRSMGEAIKLTRDGWAEGVAMAEKVAERITGQQPTRRKRLHTVAGGSVNVGRMLSGNPLHMRQRVKQPSSKIVTLVHQFNNSHTVDALDMEIRAAVVAAIADTLENNGYSCEILAVSSNPYGIAKGYESDSGRKAIDVIKLKSAGDRLNLSDVMFGLGHPSFLRRLAFARWALIKPFPYKHMGYAGKLETDNSNVLMIGKLPHKFSTKGLTFDQKLDAIIKAIVPENLPLEFKFDA